MPQGRVMAPIGMDYRILTVTTIDASLRMIRRLSLQVGVRQVHHNQTATTRASHEHPPFRQRGIMTAESSAQSIDRLSYQQCSCHRAARDYA
jgi:hypothetical protein